MTLAQKQKYRAAHDMLDQVVRGNLQTRAEAAVRLYFQEPVSGDGRIGFTGRRFERFGGGGDADAVRNEVTAADVLAVSMLGIEKGIGRVAVNLTETMRAQITELLEQIPLDPLHQVPHDTITHGSAAWRLWDVVRSANGGDRPVTAAKVLSRKRPALLPVYDSVVRRQLGAPRDIWECYWCWFDADRSRVTDTESFRRAVGGIQDISLLRCLDAALWMLGTDRG
jgi:Family of unknown function (DUF6308)